MNSELNKEKTFRYWLCRVPGLGPVKIKNLLETAKSAEAIWNSNEEQLNGIFENIERKSQERQERCVLNVKDKNSILESKNNFYKNLEDYKKMELSGVHFLTPDDEEYPDRLRILYDLPQEIYYRGNLPLKERFSVSIVGARRCSDYGIEIASYLGKAFTFRGATVISGMAEGIDGAAHRGAIEGIYERRRVIEERNAYSGVMEERNAYSGVMEERNAYSEVIEEPLQLGKTLAILGNGIDRCYPVKNIDIYRELLGNDPFIDCGGLLSEYPIGTAPASGHFPRRNRMISAMGDILVVVEAKAESGSLITADQALELGKEVFVVPGRINDPLSEGCNNLIAQGASVITNLDSFLDEVCPTNTEWSSESDKIKKNLATDEKMVYSCLDFIPKHLGEILENSGLEMQIVLSALRRLQKIGLVKETAKNFYALKLT